MTPSIQTISPLRQRMLDDMRMRKLQPRTQEAYIRAVRNLAAYLKRSPGTATVEDLRNFQLHLVDAGSGPQKPGSNPHSVCARNTNIGVFRGFHHRGLCDTCPQAGIDCRVGCRSGQVSHNPKLLPSSKASSGSSGFYVIPDLPAQYFTFRETSVRAI